MQSFNDFNLSENTLKAITDLGFQAPTPIQVQTLPILMGNPTDFLGMAATGTGKTAAFAIPVIEKMDPTIRGVQAIVMCPTRELALQVADQFKLLSKYQPVKTAAIYGGAGYTDQIRAIRGGAQVVVGTPGRIVDHLNRGTLKLDQVKTVILDEADEMISMGFKEDMETILKDASSTDRKTWLFSATMDRDVRRVADTYLSEPQKVQVNQTEVLPENVEQIFYVTRDGNKPEVLCKLIDSADTFYGLIFCQTKSLVIDITQYLKARGYRADCLHGDMSQGAREMTLKLFRAKKLTMLVCTDVASRGIDVKDMTHVINYSIPRELEVYIHRIGRTARSGKSGIAMSLVTSATKHLIPKLERITKSKISQGTIPGRREIGITKLSKALQGFQSQTDQHRAIELMDAGWQDALSTLTAQEVAGRFLAMMFPEVFSTAASADLVREEPDHRTSSGPRNRKERFERRMEKLTSRKGGFTPRSEIRSKPSELDQLFGDSPSSDESSQTNPSDAGPGDAAAESALESNDVQATADRTAPSRRPGFAGRPSRSFDRDNREDRGSRFEKRGPWGRRDRDDDQNTENRRSRRADKFEGRGFEARGFGQRRDESEERGSWSRRRETSFGPRSREDEGSASGRPSGRFGTRFGSTESEGRSTFRKRIGSEEGSERFGSERRPGRFGSGERRGRFGSTAGEDFGSSERPRRPRREDAGVDSGGLRSPSRRARPDGDKPNFRDQFKKSKVRTRPY